MPFVLIPPSPLLMQLIYLPPPWGDCKSVTMESEFYDTYSITACRIDCETRYLVENCNCRMVHMPGKVGGGDLNWRMGWHYIANLVIYWCHRGQMCQFEIKSVLLN